MDPALGRMRTCFSSCFFFSKLRSNKTEDIRVPLPIESCEYEHLHRNEHQLICRAGGKRVNHRIFSSLSEIQNRGFGQVMQWDKKRPSSQLCLLISMVKGWYASAVLENEGIQVMHKWLTV